MTQNRLVETRQCVERYLPYVDQVVLVDGGSIDDSIFYFRNWAQKEPKIKFFLHPWKDNFPEQRNNYLKHVPDNTWALVSDPDEWFEDDLLKNLQTIIAHAEAKKKDMIGFRCRSVSYQGPVRVWENLDNYWKRLLFKKYPGTHYEGNPHEHLVNHPHQMLDTKFIYEHIKQETVIWHRGARNMFTGGGGPNLGTNNKHWIALREHCKTLGIDSWHKFEAYLLKGNIDQGVKNLLYTFKDLNGWDGSSEHREMYKLYFRVYHPEEEPTEYKDQNIP
jgi:glycosyltransferase involved in cell wall biosynthesis